MRVLSISPILPFEEVPHAGGVYYFHHLRALIESGADVDVVVPSNEANLEALESAPRGVSVSFFQTKSDEPWGSRSLIRRLRPIAYSRRYARSLASFLMHRIEVGNYDLVEIQWTEMAWFVVSRAWSPGLPTVVVGHDILVQRYGRARDAAKSATKKLVRTIAYLTARHDESRILRATQFCLALSEKDAQLAATTFGVRSGHVNPPLYQESAEVGRDPRGAQLRSQAASRRVIFVGAFNREENSEGALWFAREIWPRVQSGVAGAEAVFAGSGPTEKMQSFAESSSGIHITGYVSDLQEYYEAADVVVVPLLRGAGIKLKTISGLLSGKPVVTTSVGAEGIAANGSGVFWAIEDDPEQFADSVVQALLNPEAALAQGKRGQVWAQSQYGYRDFMGALIDRYKRLTNG